MIRFGVTVAVVLAMLAARAEAFCGFYIDTGGGAMFNDATQVVLMRDGTRTVLSMQNNYQGPLQDFALVVPVPTVLKQGDVRTLPKSLFQKVNAMSAPRLVEYWEVDPCLIPDNEEINTRYFSRHASAPEKFGVTIESRFDIDEYQIVILSAKDSTGLDRYLRAEHYQIPKGAAPLLRPYVEAGSKFFVAKVDPKKVRFEQGRAVLSPLRFHYDSDELTLPIRLGLANSAGTQDLIINILAPDQRYEVANYPNAFVPTNINVEDAVRTRFGEFYAALFDRTVQQHPGAVITEYAWGARSCDPCPGPFLADEDFGRLGEEVLPPLPPPPPPPPPSTDPDEIVLEVDEGPPQRAWVLTRLHARYGTTGVRDDLVFRVAPPVSGGDERAASAPGRFSRAALPATANRFQARYIIRHPWTGAIECEEPRRGVWGGDPSGAGLGTRRRFALGAATDAAEAPRGVLALQHLVATDVPELAIQRGVPLSPPLPGPTPPPVRAKGCGCQLADAPGAGALGLIALALALSARRSRRSPRCASATDRRTSR